MEMTQLFPALRLPPVNEKVVAPAFAVSVPPQVEALVNAPTVRPVGKVTLKPIPEVTLK